MFLPQTFRRPERESSKQKYFFGRYNFLNQDINFILKI